MNYTHPHTHTHTHTYTHIQNGGTVVDRNRERTKEKGLRVRSDHEYDLIEHVGENGTTPVLLMSIAPRARSWGHCLVPWVEINAVLGWSIADSQRCNKMFKYATSHLRHPGRILAFFAAARETMGLYRDLPFTADAETTIRCFPVITPCSVIHGAPWVIFQWSAGVSFAIASG